MIEPGSESGFLSKPFMEHLGDLRKALVWAALFLLVGMAVAVPFTPWIVEILKNPLRVAGLDPETFLTTTTVMGGFSIVVRTVMWSGIILSAPFVLGAIAWFVFPGLTRRERGTVIGAVVASAALFAGGAILGYVMMPMALRVFLAISAWAGIVVKFYDMANYFTFVLQVLLVFGLVFQLPIVVLALGYMGIVDSGMLRRTRRHVYVAVLIVAMVVTPQQDPFSMLALAVPLAILHEACIWILWFRERRQEGEARA
jgi:sec-independent protein translocase protein TatC